MRTFVLAVLTAATVSAGWTPATEAQASETADLLCPEQASGTVEFPPTRMSWEAEDPEWTATQQSSRVQSASIEQWGAGPVLVCHYRMFGSDYWIWRRPPERLPYCTVQAQPTAANPRASFSCTDNRR